MAPTRFCRGVGLLVVALVPSFVPAQDRPIEVRVSADGLWRVEGSIREIGERFAASDGPSEATIDRTVLEDVLARAPAESDGRRGPEAVLTLPMPGGTFARFRIVESSILDPSLAAAHPEIRTFRGQGVDDPTASARIDWTPQGFHAAVLSATGTVHVDPTTKGDINRYVASRKDAAVWGRPSFACEVTNTETTRIVPLAYATPANLASGRTLRVYRLAVAVTGEYAAVFGGTVDGALAAVTTTMNRVNGIFDREVAVRMVLVAGEASILYTDPASDPYTNGSTGAMLTENQRNLDAVLGSASYDIGHVFGTGTGGAAYLATACDSAAKAYGATGLAAPYGDTFDVDYVAHEIGHQLGADHTFNGTAASCGGGQRAPGSAMEPGSGSTIMAYAGICGSQSLQLRADDYFHEKSLEQILDVVATIGTCATNLPTGNEPPFVEAGASYNVPKRTPFVLTATAFDPDGDRLTYGWEEYDLGPSSPPDSDSDGKARPIFRSYPPSLDPTRTFPSLSYVLNSRNVPPTSYPCGGTCATGEALPIVGRTLSFAVTARDGRSGGGGVATDSARVIVSGSAGPFAVASPNTALLWPVGTTRPVEWSVSGTTGPPISVKNVKISLSTDGGATFPVVLAPTVPNNGFALVTVPNAPTAAARVKVEAVGNIFFDVSDVNFTIDAGDGGNTPPSISDIPDQVTTQDTATAPLSFSIADGETLPDRLVLSRGSSDATVVPPENVEILGSGSSRTVTVTPAPGRTGSSTVTITVTDDGGLTVTDGFTVTVTSAPVSNNPPTISDIADQSTPQSTTTAAISFTIGDTETPPASLVLSRASSNPTLLPLSGIALAGSGALRTVTLTPAAGRAGSSTVTILVTDAGGLTARDSFVLTATGSSGGSSPDLRVTALGTIPASGDAAPGGTISITDSTANAGAGAAGASTTRFYLSADANFGGDVALAPVRDVGPLGRGTTSSGTTMVTLPEDIGAGRWYVVARADDALAVTELSETNNTQSTPLNVGPDLTVSGFSIPSRALRGSTISVTVTTTNAGAGPAAASMTRIYYSSDNFLSIAADPLLGAMDVAALTPGSGGTATIAVRIPTQGAPPGTHFLFAVADGAKSVAEARETNNNAVRSLVVP